MGMDYKKGDLPGGAIQVSNSNACCEHCRFQKGRRGQAGGCMGDLFLIRAAGGRQDVIVLG